MYCSINERNLPKIEIDDKNIKPTLKNIQLYVQTYPDIQYSTVTYPTQYVIPQYAGISARLYKKLKLK